MILFSSNIEYDAAFPDGRPDGLQVRITGVGLADAAIATAGILAREAPAQLVFVGTCGAYPGSALDIGDVVIVRDVVLASGDVVRGAMRVPSLMTARIIADAPLSQRIIDVRNDRDLRRVDCACTLGVTEDDELAALLAREADVENLEAFAVARAAASAAPPVATAFVLGVTNHVGVGGGAAWAANYVRMMREAAAVALSVEL